MVLFTCMGLEADWYLLPNLFLAHGALILSFQELAVKFIKGFGFLYQLGKTI